MKRLGIHIVSFLLVAALAVAETAEPTVPEAPFKPLDLKSHLTSDKVKLGEVFIYQVSIQHRRAERYELVVPKASDVFEFIGHKRQRRDGSDYSTTRFLLKMALFELGPHPLPVL